MPDGPEIAIQKVHELISEGQEIVLLDVRTVDEFNSDTGHFVSSRNIPVQELANRLDELDDVKSSDIVVYCKSGGRSALAQSTLAEHGFKAWSMTGGITAWIATYNHEFLEETN
jgi:rhodanese-related sulfurtransferase